MRFQVEIRSLASVELFSGWFQVDAETEAAAIEVAQRLFRKSEPAKNVVDYMFTAVKRISPRGDAMGGYKGYVITPTIASLSGTDYVTYSVHRDSALVRAGMVYGPFNDRDDASLAAELVAQRWIDQEVDSQIQS